MNEANEAPQNAESPQLHPHPENPRLITAQQREMLKKSLDEFGDLSGVVFNRRTQRLVGGHQRVSVLNGLRNGRLQIVNRYDEPTAQGTVLEGLIEHDGERFSYREVDWDEDKAVAAMIAANQQGGEFDESLLADLVNRHEETEGDPDLLGFDRDEFTRLVELADSPTDADDGVAEQRDASDELADTNFTLGQYRFKVDREEYLAWQESLRQSAGFDNAAATAEIRKRLGL